MKITEDNFTITTIYFDGQFWRALIERCEDGKTYAGRHVFGAEPSNPEILSWMVHGFVNVPLLPVEGCKRTQNDEPQAEKEKYLLKQLKRKKRK